MRTNNFLSACLAVVLFLFTTLSAKSGRSQTVSLSGEWKFCVAPPLIDIAPSRIGNHFDPPQLSPELTEVISAEARENPGIVLLEDAKWQPITIPAGWEQTAGIDFNGAGCYRRTINIPPEWVAEGKQIWLEFDAVATVAGVWLNNHWLGGNVGDYTQFRLEASSVARSGANELLVYVDELPGHITQGFLNNVAPHHGGIWQEVRMFATGPLAIEASGIYIQTTPATKEIHVDVRFNGNWMPEYSEPALSIRRYDPAKPHSESAPLTPVEGSYTVSVNADNQMITFKMRLKNIEIWEPKNPALYIAEIRLPASSRENTSGPSDIVSQTFGFRTIEIRGSEVLLNGEPLNIRSVLNWGYYPRIVSPAPPPEVVREEFAYIQSLGFNAETICLMVMPDYFYDIADEMGLLIWNEYPTWHNDFTKKHLPTYRRMFPEFYRRDRNHPSIILRSISVEAGVKDQTVMAELVALTREMTDTPVQDNNSWIWMSNPDLTDWYGDDNYWNNNSWVQYYLLDLPTKLDSMAEKPYMMGETIAGTVWIDADTLQKIDQKIPLSNWIYGTDAPNEGEEQPYWFPICYQACLEAEQQLRARYNSRLPDGEDIVLDYLIPQGYEYSRRFRKFQIELLYSDPRYAGFTLFLIRDLPQIRSGLIDDTGRPRWKPEDWRWFGDHTASPVLVADLVNKDTERPLIELTPQLSQWDPDWGIEPARDTPVRYLNHGYADLKPLFSAWPSARGISETEVKQLSPANEAKVLVSDIILNDMVDYLERGGVVLLFTNKWPGGLGSQRNMYWADAFFAPPVGPFDKADCSRLVKLHQFDLTHTISQVIPVEELGIVEQVDPLLRLFGLHDLGAVVHHDQLFATLVGKGLLVASALDHSAEGGQWVLGKVIEWANAWDSSREANFPVTELPAEKLRSFAVSRVNDILSINADWRFKLDPDQQGENQKWWQTEYDDTDWAVVQANMLWESQGYRYDGMAWYRRYAEVPKKFAGRKIYLVAEGVDDAYRLWINGEFVAKYGSFTEHAKSVHRTKTEIDLTDIIELGKPNLFVLQVIDLYGGGGIGKPIYFRVE